MDLSGPSWRGKKIVWHQEAFRCHLSLPECWTRQERKKKRTTKTRISDKSQVETLMAENGTLQETENKIIKNSIMNLKVRRTNSNFSGIPEQAGEDHLSKTAQTISRYNQRLQFWLSSPAGKKATGQLQTSLTTPSDRHKHTNTHPLHKDIVCVRTYAHTRAHARTHVVESLQMDCLNFLKHFTSLPRGFIGSS